MTMTHTNHRHRSLLTTLAMILVLGVGMPSMATTNFATATSDRQTPDSMVLSTPSQTHQHTQNTSRQPTTVTHDKLILNSPVIDEAHILTASEKAHLEAQLRRIYDDKLAQMALVIVSTTNGMDIFDYAMRIADRWQLGKKDTDEGILMVVSINDRKLHILTGYGVEGVLPDVVIKRIIREDITPSFKTGEYAQGLSAGIARIDERLRADPDTLARADSQHETDEGGVELVPLFIMALFFGTFLTAIFGRFLGSSICAGGFVLIASMAGMGLLVAIAMALVLWILLMLGIIGGRRGVVVGGGSGGFGGNSGGFGGGFGSGGFGGGGGGFGGGGAGGSW